METEPLMSKRTCESLSSYNAPTTSTAEQDQSNKDELLRLVQKLKKDKDTLIKENLKLKNGFGKIMLTNRDLLSSNMKYAKLMNELNENFHLEYDDYICFRENNVKLSNEISTKKSQIVIFQNLNNKYINENKVLKSNIEKI